MASPHRGTATRAAAPTRALSTRSARTRSVRTMIYAALDGWRRQMVQHGHDLLGAALAMAERVRHGIGALPGLHVLRGELLRAEASHDLDPLQVVIGCWRPSTP